MVMKKMENLILKRVQNCSNLNIDKNSFLVFNTGCKNTYIVSNKQIIGPNSDTKKFETLTTFENKPEIVHVCNIVEDELLFILFIDGTILTYDLVTGDVLKHSLSVTEISGARFSHSQEFLVLSCKNGEMLLFNKLLTLKAKYDMNQDEYGCNEMVNVNWGSKSTQFHGPGMRDHRETKTEFIPLSAWDDSKCSIEWRHDDSLFIINFVCNQGYRLLKIFNREGILQHTSEYTAGLEKSIAWKPSGKIIAASKMTPKSHEIIFFEKNGLQHGGFCLKYKPNTFVITKLSWSSDSVIFMICGYRVKENEKIGHEILLYSHSNYQWYLKQKIQFPDTVLIEDIRWDECQPLKLHLLSSEGYISHLYERKIQVSEGNLFIIDGDQLKITDLNQTVVPPPLYSYSIKFGTDNQQQIGQICFFDDALAVLLENGMASIFKISNNAKQEDFEKPGYDISYEFINVSDEFESVYLSIRQENLNNLRLCSPILDSQLRIYGILNQKTICCLGQKNHELEFSADSLILLPDDKLLILNSFRNEFYILDPITEKVERAFQDVSKCYDSTCSRVAIHHDDSKRIHLIALTVNDTLYYDQILVIKSKVDSFVVFNNQYLLFTTIDNQFYCWPLNNFNLDELTQRFPGRNLERYSEIVTVSKLHSRVIMTLPRGNLEAFSPLLLLLDRIDRNLKNLNYVEAMEIVRMNHISLNYICDFNMKMFLEHCDEFLDQLSKKHMDWIILFLFQLSSSNHYSILANQSPVNQMENKLNIVCDTLSKALKPRLDNDPGFIKPFLLCHLKKEPAEIAEALKIVKNLDESSKQEQAVKFMLLIIDMTRLLEEALGTYDFDIFLMVASRSNRDPKEYLPLVEKFQNIEDVNYRRASIDRHLKRYKKCLYHLSRCPDQFQETLELIGNKHLFKEAIGIFDLNNPLKKSDTIAKSIWNIYGEYLFRKGYYEEAGIAYKRAENYSQALKMYVVCSNWNAALVCARKTSGNSNEEFLKVVKTLTQNLVANQRFIDGAFLVERYLENPLEAFRILIKGRHWEEAMRCHRDHGLDETLIDQELIPEVVDTCEELIKASSQITDQIEEYLSRLRELFESGQTDREFQTKVTDIDMYSETSSIGDSDSINSHSSDSSRETLKTHRSGQRNRRARKLEQRKYQLRRGSPNEDIQIIYALKELIGEKSNAIFKDVPSVIKMAYEMYQTEKSAELQKSVGSMETAINQAMEFVWNSGDFARQLSDDSMLRIEESLLKRPNWKIVLPS